MIYDQLENFEIIYKSNFLNLISSNFFVCADFCFAESSKLNIEMLRDNWLSGMSNFLGKINIKLVKQANNKRK